MKFEKHIIHPIGSLNETPPGFIHKLFELRGEILGIKLHPAFIIYMMNQFSFNVMQAVKDQGFMLMIDDKSHDIPSETAEFIKMYGDSGADIITIHASGGPRMLEAAVKAAPKDVLIFGVTLLTSLEDWEVPEVYVTEPEMTVVRLANLVENAGCHGSVCAPRDLAWLKANGLDLSSRTRLCPNIRDPKIQVKNDDQNLNRSLSPAEAASAGVDIMVVGRALKNASKPGEVARKMELNYVRS